MVDHVREQSRVRLEAERLMRRLFRNPKGRCWWVGGLGEWRALGITKSHPGGSLQACRTPSDLVTWRKGQGLDPWVSATRDWWSLAHGV